VTSLAARPSRCVPRATETDSAADEPASVTLGPPWLWRCHAGLVGLDYIRSKSRTKNYGLVSHGRTWTGLAAHDWDIRRERRSGREGPPYQRSSSSVRGRQNKAATLIVECRLGRGRAFGMRLISGENARGISPGKSVYRASGEASSLTRVWWMRVELITSVNCEFFLSRRWSQLLSPWRRARDLREIMTHVMTSSWNCSGWDERAFILAAKLVQSFRTRRRKKHEIKRIKWKSCKLFKTEGVQLRQTSYMVLTSRCLEVSTRSQQLQSATSKTCKCTHLGDASVSVQAMLTAKRCQAIHTQHANSLHWLVHWVRAYL